MANPALIGFSAIGDQSQPSPSIWGDCANSALNDLGLGYFVSRHFVGDDTTGAAGVAPGILSSADTAVTFPYDSTDDHSLDITTDTTDNRGGAIFTNPLGSITRGSGNRLWAETNVSFTTLGDESAFFGLTTQAGLTKAILTSNPSNSAIAGTDASHSHIGFVTRQTASAIAKLDIVLQKTSGARVTIATDVTNSSAITAAGGTIANLVAATKVKLGVRFDGQHTLYFYVNGFKVLAYTVDSTVDQSATYGAILCLHNGTTTAFTAAVDFFQAAAKIRS